MEKVTLEMSEVAFWRIVKEGTRRASSYHRIETNLQVIEDPDTGEVTLRLWLMGTWTDLVLKED